MFQERKQRILVFDFCPHLADDIAEILGWEDYIALGTTRPENVLAILDIFCPDALIIGTYPELYKSPLFRRCVNNYPTFYLTSSREASIQLVPYLSRQDYCLSKPFDIEDLLIELKRILKLSKTFFDDI